MKIISVMNEDALRLALKYYGDATGFVEIMEENQLDDWLINKAVITPTLTAHLQGDSILTMTPTLEIRIGDLVYCDGLDTYATVLVVENFYSTPTGTPFASCPSQPPAPTRILPPSGTWVSTNISITPALDNALALGSPVTFAIGAPTDIRIPNNPNKRGILT